LSSTAAPLACSQFEEFATCALFVPTCPCGLDRAVIHCGSRRARGASRSKPRRATPDARKRERFGWRGGRKLHVARRDFFLFASEQRALEHVEERDRAVQRGGDVRRD